MWVGGEPMSWVGWLAVAHWWAVLGWWKWWDAVLGWICPVGRWDPVPMRIPMQHLDGSCQVEDWEWWPLQSSMTVEEWGLAGSRLLCWLGAPEGAQLAQEPLRGELGWPGNGGSMCPVPRGAGMARVRWAPLHPSLQQIGLAAV